MASTADWSMLLWWYLAACGTPRCFCLSLHMMGFRSSFWWYGGSKSCCKLPSLLLAVGTSWHLLFCCLPELSMSIALCRQGHVRSWTSWAALMFYGVVVTFPSSVPVPTWSCNLGCGPCSYSWRTGPPVVDFFQEPHCGPDGAGPTLCWHTPVLAGHRLDLRLTSVEIPFNEFQGSIGLGPDVGDMLVQTELVVDGHAQVFGTVDFLQGASVQCVSSLSWLSLVGYVYHRVLLWMKLHLPQVFPVLESLSSCSVSALLEIFL